ncbi:MAG: hypothetical protein QHH10_04490 [Peptococcaceae bacterium]|nr:hypothetical protein [Peptococcaceae bacterium]MDH7524555.1 hypothetical protein [Peptococcaceae bacterium]
MAAGQAGWNRGNLSPVPAAVKEAAGTGLLSLTEFGLLYTRALGKFIVSSKGV